MVKIIKADWVFVKEAEQLGNMASMSNYLSKKGSELSKKLGDYFSQQMPSYNEYIDEDDCEDVFYNVDEYLEEKGIDKSALDFPYTSGSEIHLIPITENLSLKLLIVDDYHGGGYSRYINAGEFMINERTTEEDVDKLIQFVNQNLKV